MPKIYLHKYRFITVGQDIQLGLVYIRIDDYQSSYKLQYNQSSDELQNENGASHLSVTLTSYRHYSQRSGMIVGQSASSLTKPFLLLEGNSLVIFTMSPILTWIKNQTSMYSSNHRRKIAATMIWRTSASSAVLSG